jgi:hypothetical protein
MRRLVYLFVVPLVTTACDASRAEAPDAHLIYAAAIAVTGEQVSPIRKVALDPHLLTDTGTYHVSGRLSDSVIALLLDLRVVDELCGYGEGERDESDCVTDSARVVVPFSRPLFVHRDTAAVFLTAWNVKPKTDTSDFFLPFDMSERCRIVRSQGIWVRDSCETITIT